MKVLHVITRLNQGGTARWLEKLSKGLTSADWESVVVVGEVGSNELEDSCFPELLGLRVKSLGKEKGLLNDIRSFFILRKIISDQKPDLVNTHTSKAGVIGRLAANSFFSSRPRVIHTYHGHLLYGYFPKPLTQIIVLVEKCMSSLTDRFISAGKTVRDELVQSGIGDVSDYSIINPGVDSPAKFDSIIRDRFGISKDSIVVGWMGRFEKVKSPQRVLDLANQFPSVIFLMAGTGKLFTEIQSKAPANLFLPGWSDANEIWSASDIALLTSENEALPIVLIEAGLAGLPAVAENVGAVAEVISDKITGFLCNSFEERVQAITLLIEDSKLRGQMGSNARIQCLTNFSPEKFIDDHIAAYLSVLPQ